ncbi:hypothetical protein QTH87_06780 [Variovorax sp. J22P168]|uniref:hypothetical protein n=1 Tax=Variovorax jilinensis TaxID=3053513 RepID=UPI0025749A1A|nr:hypothetical protein [Variovorax sp. J22P168]MDM0012144.1 hypothetical protein [Variovorax sp. J22P168]
MESLDGLDDEELASSAYVWRMRARQGDRQANEIAQAMEAELRRRLGSTPSMSGPLELLPQVKPKAPWWRFW